MEALLQTENEGRLGFELWSRFARFFCAFALDMKFVFSELITTTKNILFLNKRQSFTILDALQIAIKLIYVEQDKMNVMLNTRITKGKEIQ